MRLYYVAYSPLDLQSANSVQTFHTVRELHARLGKDLQVIVPRFGGEAPPPFPVRRLTRVPVNKLSRLRPAAWYSYAERLLYAARVERALGAAAGLVYTRDIVCAYRLARAGRAVLYEVHDLESRHPGRARSARLQEWLERVDESALRKARGVVSLTATFAKELVERGWQSPERVFVIPDAYDERVYFPRPKAEARAALQLDAGRALVVYAGLTFKYRGLDVLLQALAGWPEAQVALVGGRPQEVRELQALAVELGAADRVSFAGRKPAETVAQYLAGADVLVLPDTVTDSTASPLKMFEYMAMARPIVCVDRPALREILGDAAVYFRRGDASELAAALKVGVGPGAEARAERAYTRSKEFTYGRRADKIVRAAETVMGA